MSSLQVDGGKPKSGAWLIGIAIAVVVAIVISGVWYVKSFLVPQVDDRTEDWGAFYQESFSQYFFIPDEATIISATYTAFPIMGSTSRVVFRLPDTQSPSEWVALIAEKSEISEFRQSDTWYDASHLVNGEKNKVSGTRTDQHYIRYLSEDETYEAVGGWD